MNEAIYHCFSYLPEEEARKFVRKFQEQPHEQIQVMHTFRELLLGAFLAQNGFIVSYDRKIGAKTPDWCILENESVLQGIIELVNFHPSAKTSSDIADQLRTRGIWCNFVAPNTERLYQSIWEKASAYKKLAVKNDLAFIIAVFGEFTAIVDQEEIEECLLDSRSGIFQLYPEVSGLLYFEESSGNYHFSYRANNQTNKPIEVPSGVFETR